MSGKYGDNGCDARLVIVRLLCRFLGRLFCVIHWLISSLRLMALRASSNRTASSLAKLAIVSLVPVFVLGVCGGVSFAASTAFLISCFFVSFEESVKRRTGKFYDGLFFLPLIQKPSAREAFADTATDTPSHPSTAIYPAKRLNSYELTR